VPSLTYHRPKTLDEALALLDEGLPLGGGTWLTPRRSTLTDVIDLQDLDLAGFEATDRELRFGAGLRLEDLRAHLLTIAPSLAAAVRREMALNMRHQATLGGVLHTAGGRSALLTCLLTTGLTVKVEPGDRQLTLPALLEKRQERINWLATQVVMPRPAALSFDLVARSPMDLPIVVAAASRTEADGGQPVYRLALGGYGAYPMLLAEAGEALAAGDVQAVGAAAEAAYRQAGDAWAGAAYRSQVAGVLARRVAQEVSAQ